jgi:diacylglycerol kinase family enzyme
VPQHFIVNPASGGGAGLRLAQELATVVGGGRVSLLGRCDPATVVAGLGPDDAVVACGGDGTASSLAAVVATRGADAPALGVVPLGTGNDLARVLGWRGWSDVPALVTALAVAGRRWLDRWRIAGPGLDRGWCNYLSLGLDASVALRFHHLRLRHRWLARGPVINRGLYGVLGAQQRGNDLARCVRVGGGMRLPRWAAGLVLDNIPSYAGGVVLAQGMRIDDGRFEMLALGAGLALGLVTARLRRPRLLGRHTHLELDLGTAMAMQLDGEPILAPPGRYRITRAPGVHVLVADGAPCVI